MADLALAMLRAGCSYDEAARCSGLTLAEVMKLLPVNNQNAHGRS